MATQALFYERVTPVSTQRHGNWCVEAGSKYEFARQVNSVPLATVEIPHAAREYTIVFAGTDEVQPIVLLGVGAQENLYVTEDGGWDAEYIPAFVRRYPFVFSKNTEEDKFTLCIDESWDGCNQEGRGKPLFDDKGERSPYMQEMIGFVTEYQRQFQRTQQFCQKLKELELLETNQMNFTLPGGEKQSLGGFMIVSRDKLNALPAETLSELAQSGALELTYTHLQSVNNMSLVLKRVAARQGTSTADQTEELPVA